MFDKQYKNLIKATYFQVVSENFLNNVDRQIEYSINYIVSYDRKNTSKAETEKETKFLLTYHG